MSSCMSVYIYIYIIYHNVKISPPPTHVFTTFCWKEVKPNKQNHLDSIFSWYCANKIQETARLCKEGVYILQANSDCKQALHTICIHLSRPFVWLALVRRISRTNQGSIDHITSILKSGPLYSPLLHSTSLGSPVLFNFPIKVHVKRACGIDNVW